MSSQSIKVSNTSVKHPLLNKLDTTLRHTNTLAQQPLTFIKEHFPKVFFFAEFCYDSGLLADFISLLILTAFSSCLPFYYLLVWKIYYESMYAGNMKFFIQCTFVVLCFGVLRSSIESFIDILRDNLSCYLSDHYSMKTHRAFVKFYTIPENVKDKDSDTSGNIPDDQENFFQCMNDMLNRYVSLFVKMLMYIAFLVKSCGLRLYHRYLLFVPLTAATTFAIRSVLLQKHSEESTKENHAKNLHRQLFQKIKTTTFRS